MARHRNGPRWKIIAADCAACAEELRAWKNLSIAASELHHDWDSPALWPRIEQALSQQQARNVETFPLAASIRFVEFRRAAMANGCGRAASGCAYSFCRVVYHELEHCADAEQNPALLTDRAVNDVERAEACL